MSVTFVDGPFVYNLLGFRLKARENSAQGKERSDAAQGKSIVIQQPERLRAERQASLLSALQAEIVFLGHPGRRSQASSPWAEFSQPFRLMTQ